MVKIEIEVNENVAYILKNWMEFNGETPGELIKVAFEEAFGAWSEETDLNEIIKDMKEAI